MRQPTPKNKNVPKKKITKKKSGKRWHPQYGTSKLEEDFASQFLDKLGVKYVYQFEAKDIGRFFDFYLPELNLLLEVHGDWWHGHPDKYKEEELRGHQKRAQRVDEHKTKWALMHGIPLLVIWECDIRKNPKKVMETLKKELNIQQDKLLIEDNKKKRH